jgi:hypothetical protein
MKPRQSLSTRTIEHSSVRIGKRNAYHLAGRVAGILYGNKEGNLPEANFEIRIGAVETLRGYHNRETRIPRKFIARMEGGRLLANLPHSFAFATRLLDYTARLKCQGGLEADVINLLAGSLAEAKHVAQRDNEVFNANLIYLGALKFYGGEQDLQMVDEYMFCLYPDKPAERKKKLAELFLAAYGFVNDAAHWQTISRLAEGIQQCRQDTIRKDDLTAYLERDSLVEMPVLQPVSAYPREVAAFY